MKYLSFRHKNTKLNETFFTRLLRFLIPHRDRRPNQHHAYGTNPGQGRKVYRLLYGWLLHHGPQCPNDELLAEGYTEGSTGNTSRIMSQPYTRYDDLADVNTAAFRTEIPLTAPTLVTIEARAPGHHRQARVRASTQVWMIPGRDIVGDGIVLEIPGFVVDVLLPRQNQFITLESLPNRLLAIRANMVMMCGCPISDGGLWNARKMEVTAIITKDGEQVRTVPLAIGNTENLFEGKWMVDEPGTYQLTVYGFDPRTFNSGVDVVNIVINE